VSLPTFDEWHKAKYGMAFEARSMWEADESRAYLSEMVALMERASTPEPAALAGAEASPPPA
jgi:hypothetical protein